MYTKTSSSFNSKINENGRHFVAVFSIDGGYEIADIKSVKIRYYSSAVKNLGFGTAAIGSVEIIGKVSNIIEGLKGTLSIGLDISGSTEFIQMGVYNIRSAPKSAENKYTTIKAYDNMSLLDKIYVSSLTYPAPATDVLTEIGNLCGVIINIEGLSSTVTIDSLPDGYTCREILGFIAGKFGGFAICERDGSISIKWYSDSNYEATAKTTYSFEMSLQDNYTVNALKCVVATDTELQSGSGANTLSFTNPLMNQASLDAALGKVFTYMPGTLDIKGDIRLDPWDIITVSTLNGTYKVPIMEMAQVYDGGVKTSISAYADQTSNSTDFKGPVALSLDRAYQAILAVNTLVAGKISADEADLRYATIENLNATNTRVGKLETNSLTADSAVIKALQTEKLNTSDLNSETAKLGYLTADSAVIKGKLDTNQLSAEVAKLGYLSAKQAEIGYAKIDFSNVGTQVVSTSMIIDGAVTNEKVGNLSANKITSGTIDASKINVTNLNADNLTVGTINGQRIGKGSLSLDKLSEEVATKEYLDSVQKDLQGQIDGAIETFTKSEIPTLNNEPASLWTDNETRKKHIGDVCYVLNPTSSADGYCYRFANTGTEASPSYEWVLIKDSDVTKALQDIIDINGEITGIKQFDTEISSWKTETDSELSSLKSRTTTLETDIGNKVESSVFNELKQTVDENSSSITSLSTTVSKKADSSTVEELTNTVNSVKQTADTNTSSISSMQTTISKKADSSTVTALSNKTSELEQSLNGFKTTVSETYTTKTEFNNLEIGGRNYFSSKKRAVFDENNEYTLPAYANKGSFGQFYNLTVPMSYFVGKNCKLSFDAISPNGDTKLSIYNRNGNPRYLINENVISTVSTTWAHQELTITVTDRGETYSESSSNKIEFYFPTQMGCKIRNVKFELGNKATDWSPAPEDTDAAITAVETIATQTADKFNWLVKSGTSATDFTLTDRTAELVSDHINLNGLVTFSGLDPSAVSAISDTIEVGGKNLLRFTDKLPITNDLNTGIKCFLANYEGFVNTDDGAKLYFGGNGNIAIQIPLANEGSIENGQTVTLSFDYRGNITSFGTFYFMQKTGTNASNSGFPSLVVSETEWQHYEYTFSNENSNSGTCTSIMMLYWLPSYGSDKWIEIKKGSLKLEKGNKVTDWTPAPEDISVENIYTANTTTIDGGKITTGSIKAGSIDVDELFAENITMDGTFEATSSGWICPDATDYERIKEINWGATPTAEELKYYDFNNDGKISLIDRAIARNLMWGTSDLQDVIDRYGYEPQYSNISLIIKPSDSDGLIRTIAKNPLGRTIENRITATTIYYNSVRASSIRSDSSNLGDAVAKSLTIDDCDVKSKLDKLDSLISIQKGQIPVSGGISTNISAPTIDGYTFYCWINVSCNGFVGSPYIAGAENMEAIIWDNNYTTNTSLSYEVIALYVKN